MPRFNRLAGALALALGCAGAAQAQEFSNVVVFGDSLSDSGNIAQAQGLPAGFSFTTNPDPVVKLKPGGRLCAWAMLPESLRLSPKT